MKHVSTRLGVLLAVAAVVAQACGGQTEWPTSSPPQWPSDDDSGFGGSFAPTPTLGLGEGGQAAPERAAVQSASTAMPAEASSPLRDAGADDGQGNMLTSNEASAGEGAGSEAANPPFDAAPEGACAQPLGPGDLEIDELMIESVAGTGDYGQWLEVQSKLDCAVDLKGVRGECPRGARVATFEVGDDLWLPPRGSFVVADSINPAINHNLPGVVMTWSVGYGDVLRKKGTTVTLLQNDVIIDSITYPALALTVGASVAFPSDCDPSMRSDWSLWQTSEASWFPGFFGTPNAPNTDVHCTL